MNDRVRSVPWSIHVLKIDRSRPELKLFTTLAQNEVLGVRTLTQQIRALPGSQGRPLAAMNGDFYRTEQESFTGDPRGLHIISGELISAPNHQPCFFIDPDGEPHFAGVTSELEVIWPNLETTRVGLNEERPSNAAVLYTPRFASSTRSSGGRELVLERDGQHEWLPLRPGQVYSTRVREVREAGNTRLSEDVIVLSIGHRLAGRMPDVSSGARVRISTGTSPGLKGVQMALGGGPLLVHRGVAQSIREYKSNQRHPRSAFGWNATHYFFVVVDGRQRGRSVGMTLPELAEYLARQGCEEAINLDGGGSVEMWIDGAIVNRPCYGYERKTANSLVLLRRRELTEK